LLLGLLRGAAGGVLVTALPPAARARLLQDERIVLTVLGILQPASAEDVFCLLTVLFDTTDAEALGLERPEADQTARMVERLRRSGDLLAVQEKPTRLYSMTLQGNDRLSFGLRETRDKTRLFLLNGPRARIMGMSREERAGVSGGASPLIKLRWHIEELVRPYGSNEGQPSPQHALSDKAVLWLRRCRTSPQALSRGTALRFLSFDGLDQLRNAGGAIGATGNARITSQGIALCLGVSLEMLSWLQIDRRARHYRIFDVAKRGGGRRPIESPRIFLKVVQRFILHHILADRPVHEAVYSFVPSTAAAPRRNAITNARQHLGGSYLAKIDISDFFGSLRYRWVQEVYDGISVITPGAGQLLARLSTIPHENGPWTYLPQGAPTSPMISNLALRSFDDYMAGLSADLGVVYTRYADDIAISGRDRRSVKVAALLARRQLTSEPLRLTVHARKSRFVGPAEQQRVTGVVVNEQALPPRKLRRRVRAMFHQASLDRERLAAERPRLRGYLSYFRAFPNYPADELERYASILERS
jgi:hypothetical protein